MRVCRWERWWLSDVEPIKVWQQKVRLLNILKQPSPCKTLECVEMKSIERLLPQLYSVTD